MTGTETSKAKQVPGQSQNPIKPTNSFKPNDPRTLQAQIKAEQRARNKAEKALSEAQDCLLKIRVELDEEIQAHVQTQQELAAMQKLFAETRALADDENKVFSKEEQGGTTTDIDINNEPSMESEKSLAPQENSNPHPHELDKPDAFVIRLSVNKNGQVMRTEIEHLKSGTKDTFASLDKQRLVNFIESMITTTESDDEMELVYQPEPMLEEKFEQGSLRKPFIIANIKTYCSNENGEVSMVFHVNQPIIIRTDFNVLDIENLTSSSQTITYIVQVYAYGIDTHSSTMIATATTNLLPGVSEYSTQMHCNGLPTGLFRLLILINFQPPANHHQMVDGPFLRVSL